MTMVFVALGACPPWTEGRKNFVRDLAREFGLRGAEVRLLTGVQGQHMLLQACSMLVGLWWLLLTGRARRIVQFPHGRFGGWRGRINRVIAVLVKSSARLGGIPVLTLLYSADGITLAEAVKRFGNVAAVGVRHPGVHLVHLGVDISQAESPSAVTDGPVRLLFLCGYQVASEASIAGVLHERGLERLLKACNGLDRDITVTIAIPFLRDGRTRARFQRLAGELCPAVPVRFDGNTTPVAALLSHSVFVFPYVTEHEVFVPTSMLEAMWLGVPVVASDRRMYRALTWSDGGPNCVLDARDSIDGLRDALHASIDDLPFAKACAIAATARIRNEWSIAHAADDLVAALPAAEEG